MFSLGEFICVDEISDAVDFLASDGRKATSPPAVHSHQRSTNSGSVRPGEMNTL